MYILEILFSINLILLALDHFISGFLGVFYPKAAIRFYKTLFGISIPSNDEYVLLLKPWGALGMFAAMVGILPIHDPNRYKIILVLLLLLLIIRIVIRTINNKQIDSYLKIKNSRNLLHILLIWCCAIIISFQLFYLY